jgi:uncharacterized protein (DUF362 family)
MPVEPVGIVKTNGNIKEALTRALYLIGGLESYVRPHDRVLLKPNLNDTGLVTDIGLTDTLIILLKEYGVSHIAIGESTFGTAEMTDVLFKKSGYDALAARHGIPLYNLNRSRPIAVPVTGPLAADTLRIAEEAMEADAIINLPVMKVHYATGVTLCMKNLKGLLVGEEKRRFHDIGLERAIADLNSTISPALHIIDATTCMERMGPKGGDLLELGLLLAGGGAAETDCIGCRVMGYDPHEIKHLSLYADRCGIDLDAVRAVGEPLDAVMRPFKKVDMAAAIPPGMRVHASRACSSCMNALILSCSFLDKEIENPIDLYMGSGWDAVPPGALAFGNCAAKTSGASRCVRGCPPFPMILKKIL